MNTMTLNQATVNNHARRYTDINHMVEFLQSITQPTHSAKCRGASVHPSEQLDGECGPIAEGGGRRRAGERGEERVRGIGLVAAAQHLVEQVACVVGPELPGEQPLFEHCVSRREGAQ
ncbi:hypothetical protein GUJ93_ZPchr0381g29129 [Zizania palustris]|uniref:Uncharacterized protein n=1 Tax=Zizania palustris TaxID=103762 RepID=A0A8J5RDW9_ZIZPA|nr:hypothetical protein GUJ93_ZPchr0381g29129 [Zizania palustris]